MDYGNYDVIRPYLSALYLKEETLMVCIAAARSLALNNTRTYNLEKRFIVFPTPADTGGHCRYHCLEKRILVFIYICI